MSEQSKLGDTTHGSALATLVGSRESAVGFRISGGGLIVSQKRKQTGKRLRFEIFKRDGFTCQYCGQQPPDVVLQLDHIQPVSKGGENDPMNLVTACQDCNSGKADKELGSVIRRPDADLEWLATQQEIAELRRYQQSKRERDKLVDEVVTLLRRTWGYYWRTDEIPKPQEFARWLAIADPDMIEEAIIIASGHEEIWRFPNRLRYTAGVLHKLRAQKGE